MSEGSRPSPIRVFETLSAFEHAAALKAAIDLDLFTAIGEGNQSAQAVAARCSVAPRGARVLCDHLAVLGFLTKSDVGYTLAPDSAAFLDRRSPMYLGSAADFILAPHNIETFANLTEIVRAGGPPAEESGAMIPENPMWVTFAHAMAPLMARSAQQLADLAGCDPESGIKVLDIAAGHGMFGIALARKYPRCHVVAVDWPNVLEVALENARKANVTDRFTTIPGSAFEVDFGAGYDVVLLPNFLHHWDIPTNENLLRKVHAALRPGGKALILEFVVNDDRVTPPGAAAFSLVMLAHTSAGDAYTFRELEKMCRSADFGECKLHDLPENIARAVVAYK